MSNPFNRVGGGAATTAAPAGGSAAKSGLSTDTVKKDDPYSVATPTGISEHKISDFVGELVLCEPVEYIESMMTSASKDPTDVWRVNVIPLTGQLAGETLQDLLVFQVALKRELAKTYRGPNRFLLARIEMGQAKPGWSAPYLFVAPNDQDLVVFDRFKAAQG